MLCLWLPPLSIWLYAEWLGAAWLQARGMCKCLNCRHYTQPFRPPPPPTPPNDLISTNLIHGIKRWMHVSSSQFLHYSHEGLLPVRYLGRIQRVMNDLWRTRLSVSVVALHPPPLPSPVSKLDRWHTGRLRKRDKFLTGVREGKGEEPNHTTARKPGPL